jgi:hypothetical protein
MPPVLTDQHEAVRYQSPRSAIRHAKRDPSLDDHSKPPEETYSEALAFNRWARKMLPKVESFSKELATAILDDLREAVEFIEAVKQQAG